jgi:Cu2+-containing amine oxidase
MHLSEVFVPYMDSDKAWYWRTYMDSGEYGFGNSLSPLRKGVDCPSYARFLSVILPQDDGEPIEMPDAICVFGDRSAIPPGGMRSCAIRSVRAGRGPAGERRGALGL